MFHVEQGTTPSVTAYAVPAPPRGRLCTMPETLSPPLKAVPLGKVASPQAMTEGVNSLSQNLTVLPAPSGREPLAHPETLHFSQKLSRYAKGPIPEGAVAEGDWGSSGSCLLVEGVTGETANFPAMPRALPLGELACSA